MVADLPPDIPVFQGEQAAEVYQCSREAADLYEVSPYLVQTVMKIEGGWAGAYIHNTNGTYDMGPMQINSIWVDEIKRIEGLDVDANKLRDDACYNIYIGTWILAKRIVEADGDVWKGLGNYHSKTPSKHNKYLKKAYRAYLDIVDFWTKQIK